MLSKWILASSVAALSANVALTFAQPMAAKAADAPGAPTNVDHGKRLFATMGCYQCHGYAGQGSQSTGPALVPLRRDTASFLQYLRSPSGVMPSFSAKILPDVDARDILGYIRSLLPGVPAEKITLLAPYVTHGGGARGASISTPAKPSPAAAALILKGGKLFAINCAMCHGAELQGGVGPSLRDAGSKYSIDQIAALIASPPPGMPKLTPAPLSAAQVSQVAIFLHGKH